MMYRARCCGNCKNFKVEDNPTGYCSKGHGALYHEGITEVSDVCDKDFEWRDDIAGKPSIEQGLGFGEER